MSDFMPWFYANYIKPQIYEIYEGEYVNDFVAVTEVLSSALLPSFRRCEEFTAIQAFLLGLRTGAGLSAAATETTSPPAGTPR